MILREYLRVLADTPTLEEVWENHVQQMAHYGFDRLLYGYTRYRTPTSLGDPDDFVILTNHCREYTEQFVDKGLYLSAPMLHWAVHNEGACSWASMHTVADHLPCLPEFDKLVALNYRKNVLAGYTVSFKPISTRTKGAIGLAARPGLSQDDIDAVWEEHGSDIQLMNEMAHLKIINLPFKTPCRALTSRQREVLEWVGEGKTTQDIACILGLTAATVEKHLRLARESLSVETTAQAVMKAAFSNQMFVLNV